MNISTFLPFVGRKKKVIAVPEDGDPSTFAMEWTKAPVLRSRGGENYFLSSLNLPNIELSGPLPYNARQLSIALPARPIDSRSIPTNQVGGAGFYNGQVMSQPLYNSDSGGYNAALMPLVPLPFVNDYDLIAPAGAV